MDGRFMVWRHDCGMGDVNGEGPCEPRCEDPWQVDTPAGTYWHHDADPNFTTHTEAMDFAQRTARTKQHLMVCPPQNPWKLAANQPC